MSGTKTLDIMVKISFYTFNDLMLPFFFQMRESDLNYRACFESNLISRQPLRHFQSLSSKNYELRDIKKRLTEWGILGEDNWMSQYNKMEKKQVGESKNQVNYYVKK